MFFLETWVVYIRNCKIVVFETDHNFSLETWVGQVHKSFLFPHMPALEVCLDKTPDILFGLPEALVEPQPVFRVLPTNRYD